MVRSQSLASRGSLEWVKIGGKERMKSPSVTQSSGRRSVFCATRSRRRSFRRRLVSMLLRTSAIVGVAEVPNQHRCFLDGQQNHEYQPASCKENRNHENG